MVLGESTIVRRILFSWLTLRRRLDRPLGCMTGGMADHSHGFGRKSLNASVLAPRGQRQLLRSGNPISQKQTTECDPHAPAFDQHLLHSEVNEFLLQLLVDSRTAVNATDHA